MSLFVIFVYATGASLYVDRYFSRYFHAGDGILSNLKLANNAFELVKLKVGKSASLLPPPPPSPFRAIMCAIMARFSCHSVHEAPDEILSQIRGICDRKHTHTHTLYLIFLLL